MKKYIYLSLIVLAAACMPDDEYNSAKYEYAGIRTTGVATSIAEDATGTVKIPVYYGGELNNGSSFTVDYTITGGTYGTDYTVVGGTSATGSVTVATGATGTEAFGVIEIKPVADFITESNVALTVTLADKSSNGHSLGYPLAKSFKLTITDDDCDYVFDDFVGTAASKEIYSDGSTYPSGTNTYPTEFTEVDEDHVEIDNFWDSGMVLELTYNGATRTVTVVDQTWDQYGYTWTIEGTGTMSTCGKSLRVTYHLTSPNYDGGYDDTFDITYKF